MLVASLSQALEAGAVIIAWGNNHCPVFQQRNRLPYPKRMWASTLKT